MTLTVAPQGHLLVPAERLHQLGFLPGQEVRVEVQSAPRNESRSKEEVLATFRSLIGSKKGMLEAMGFKSTGEYLDWMRGPVDLPAVGTQP